MTHATTSDDEASSAIDEPADPERLLPDPNDRGRRYGLHAVAAVVVAASLFGTLASSGIWDPHELKIADLSRRIAVNLLGATNLAIDGAANDVPTATELGRGELPFTSVALGFKLFGLSDWAGRLPLALWALLGLAATYAFLARLIDRAAAAMSVIVLSTTPLYFLHARTILGDIVTMASLAIATAGLTISVFDSRLGPMKRLAVLAIGLAGMAAGLGARGLVIGVAIPGISVGLAWLIVSTAGAPRDRLGTVLGVLCLLVGIGACGAGAYLLAGAERGQFSRLIGSVVDPTRKLPTHDFVVHHLGHGLFPWSAVIPFAAGRLLRPPIAPAGGAVRESAARLTLALSAIAGLAAYAAMAPKVGHVPFGPVFALGGIAAIMFRDFERGAPASRTMAMGVGALAILFYTDFGNFPEKAFSAFGVGDVTFPESFAETAHSILRYGTVAFAALFLATFYERQREVGRPFAREGYRGWLVALKTAYSGNVAFGAIVVEAALIGFKILTYLSDRTFHWSSFETMALPWRLVARYGYLVPPLLVVLPWAAVLARDTVRFLFAKVPLTRGFAALLAVSSFGAVLSLGYYPALAAQISPKEVFESFRELAEPNAKLAMVGTGSGAASYYTGQDVETFSTETQAFQWLMADRGERRWLVVRADDLARLNSMYRAREKTNLPVLDARSSEILLVSNRLKEGETNENPFGEWIVDERPAPSRPLDVVFGGQLQALGWDVTTPDGEVVRSVTPGRRYDFRLYYEVMRPISGNWKTFIHIDGFQRRYNGDHETLGGKYPFHLWKPGDYIVDIHSFELEPNFTPGTYQVYFGFFRGSRRLEVTRGPHHDNRVSAGSLEVR